jgi:putative ATP-dependent endonuclease of OLD family
MDETRRCGGPPAIKLEAKLLQVGTLLLVWRPEVGSRKIGRGPMRLESININRFRSIKAGNLGDCGGFNVLIGKNNSGKSNILSAIHAFFTCLQDGNVVVLSPPIGQEIDFFERDTKVPIEITLVLGLSLAERDELVRNIATDAPQMKHAVEGLDPTLRLSVTMDITPPARSFAYISQIALVSAADGPNREYRRTLLSIQEPAAQEIRGKLSEAKARNQDRAHLQAVLASFDEDDWQRTRRELEGPTSGRTPATRYFLSRRLGVAGTHLVQTLDALVRESRSFADFEAGVQSLITQASEDSRVAEEEPLKNKIGSFAGEESALPNYVRKLVQALSEIKVLYLREQRKPIGNEEAERLLHLKITRGKEKELLHIKETVSALLGVQIDAFGGPTNPAKGKAEAELDVDNFLVEVNGSGTREALRLILDVEFTNPQILLVEEPEIHLHPALETTVMRYLKRLNADVQVFVTTHSTNFLDTGDMSNVYLVSKGDSTSVQLLNVEDAETLIPTELGIRLSSLFMFDRLVFVEGPSDEGILRELASTLQTNLSQANIGFVSMGGVRNFTHFAAGAVLSFLTKRLVKLWFVIDRDEREEPELKALQDMLQGRATVKVLRRREIENYLICPRAIAQFIGVKRTLAGTEASANEPIPVGEIERSIEECADELKQLAVEKRVAKATCKPVYPALNNLFSDDPGAPIAERILKEINGMTERLETTRANLSSIYEQEASAVDTAWASRMLDIVPGDILLDKICRRYGTRYVKAKDGVRLAALLLESEISTELRDIILEFAR